MFYNKFSFFPQPLILLGTESIIFHRFMNDSPYVYMYTPEKQEPPFLYYISTKGKFSNHTECSQMNVAKANRREQGSILGFLSQLRKIQHFLRSRLSEVCSASYQENCFLFLHVLSDWLWTIGNSLSLSRSPFLHR